MDDKWIENKLEKIATEAWKSNSRKGDKNFLLNLPTLGLNLDGSLSKLYDHARVWTPGFEVPYFVPKISFKPLVDAAGQYHTRDGYVHIDLSTSILSDPAATLSVLCHEACHHILDISGQNTRNRDIDEPATDLSIFVCGFGDVFLAGQSGLQLASDGWKRVHYGYLTPEQYRFAHRWVLSARSISLPTQFRPSFISRLLAFIRPSEKKTDSFGINLSLQTETEILREKAMNMLGGNLGSFERLLEYEMNANRNVTDTDALRSLIGRLEKDRR